MRKMGIKTAILVFSDKKNKMVETKLKLQQRISGRVQLAARRWCAIWYHEQCNTRSKILVAVNIKTAVFWDTTLWDRKASQHSGGTTFCVNLMFMVPCIILQFIKNPTRCNSVSNVLLVHIYVKLNVFRATHRPSSGA